MAKLPSVDVIIPSFNARYLLEKNLPTLVKNTQTLGKLIIIDNGSEDDTVPWLKKHFPETIIVHNDTNLGYTKPINQGLAKSHSEYFILINNDVLPEKDYDTRALKYFSDPTVFAVTFNEAGASWPDMHWQWGKMQFKHGEDKSGPILSAWASGGSAMFRRSIWDELGGMDEIYAPFYWEDIDIGYRAWKSGYRIIWNPSSHVNHEHESTAKKLNPEYISIIKQRNELLFNWLNVEDPKYRGRHLLFLFTHTLHHPGYIKVIFAAIFRLINHRPLPRKFIISDKQVLSTISKPYDT